MRRCDKLIKRLKGHVTRKRSEAEGVDDINTYGVLAAEGFLPGYGLDTGAVVGSYLAPRFATNLRDWDIRRPLALALREFVPGNLVYANGHRFFPRFFHLEAGEPTLFQVDVASQSVIEVGTATAARAPIGAGTTTLAAVPVCDVELPHQAHISDEEEFRFQLAVSTYGYEQERHGEGQVFTWGGRTLTLRQAVSLRLVNVGAAHLVRDGRLGYPVCLVCGQSRSPLSSEADREFAQHHLERCGRRTEDIGFYADTTADALAIQDFVDRTQGYSVVESLRQAAARVLEMEIDDLQLLALGRLGTESADMLLYDPMPGGSGLLDQMVRRWEEIVKAARELCDDCPAQCHTACIECLLHFRNAFYHRFLDRERALECFRDWGGELVFSHVIPAKLPKRDDQGAAVNFAEATLAVLLEKALDRAGSSA